MANLEENLHEQGISLDGFPLVIQYNKRDLQTALPLHRMQHLNSRNVPAFETCATSGQGILDAMKETIRLVIKDLRARRVVPDPAAKPLPGSAPALTREIGAGLEEQIKAHIRSSAAGPTIEQAKAPQVAPKPVLGAAAAMAPGVLIDAAPCNSAHQGHPRTPAFVTHLPMCGLKFLRALAHRVPHGRRRLWRQGPALDRPLEDRLGARRGQGPVEGRSPSVHQRAPCQDRLSRGVDLDLIRALLP